MIVDGSWSTGLNSGTGERFERVQAGARRLAAANARRLTCPRCGLNVADLDRHAALHHEAEA